MTGWLFPMGRGVFTQSRWWVVCEGGHQFKRPGWYPQAWRGRLSLLGSLMDRERRA